MSKTDFDHKVRNTKPQNLLGRIIDSRLVGWLANLRPIAWILRVAVRLAFRHKPGVIPKRQPAPDGIGLQTNLQRVVYDVVTALGYAAAMVATHEQEDSLPVSALYVDPTIASEEQIHQWEKRASEITGRPLSVTDPDIARVFAGQEEYKDNLSVRAFEAGKPIIANSLFDLFSPVVPLSAKPFVEEVQYHLGIRQVIAVPFFLEAMIDGKRSREIVGNLFAAKRSEISEHDELVIAAFGRQAAAAIESERRQLQAQMAQQIVFAMQTGLRDEKQILLRIARGVVDDLGYAATMVATYEPDGALPARVVYVDPSIASEEQIHQWEKRASEITGRPLSVTDPDIARVFIQQNEYKDNLSVRAFEVGRPITSNSLFDLFTPVAPLSAKPFVEEVQYHLGIRQVIAVPFFLEAIIDGRCSREIVGNLFAATRSRSFGHGEIELLQAFGLQAAAGIRNARLYRMAEERREVAQIFGKMAFSAAAYVHSLRNHVGAFRAHLQLLELIPQLQPDQRSQIETQLLKSRREIVARLEDTVDILDNLHEPWRETPDKLIDVNNCLIEALGKVIPESKLDRQLLEKEGLKTKDGIVVHRPVLGDLPRISTSPDMLRETFKVLLKNAVEAIQAKGEGGDLWLESRLGDPSHIEVSIRDSGTGIRPENRSKIFEMRWSTKETGMGFGLFWAKDYIEGLGGSIKVDSVWLAGSTFYVSFPASIGKADDS